MKLLIVISTFLIIAIIIGMGYLVYNNNSNTDQQNIDSNNIVDKIINNKDQTIDNKPEIITSPTNKNQKYEIPSTFNPVKPNKLVVSFKKGTIDELKLNDPINEIFGVLGIADIQLEKGGQITELYYYNSGIKCILKKLKLQSIIIYYNLTIDKMKRFYGKSDKNIKYNSSEYDIKKIFGKPNKTTSDGFTKEIYYKFKKHFCIFTIGIDNSTLCYVEIKKK